MDKVKFSRAAESLRQYRRAELNDFEEEVGTNPVNQVYVDPLPDNSILTSVLSANTTFVIGRKGTGKSTVFAKAQEEIRNKGKAISVYIDVKSLYDVVTNAESISTSDASQLIDPEIIRSHILRKEALSHIIAQLLNEITESCDRMSIISKWIGKARKYEDLRQSLSDIASRIKNNPLQADEIPVLQKIQKSVKSRAEREHKTDAGLKGGANITPTGPSVNIEASASDFERTLDDLELYREYSDTVMRSFPFFEIISEIKSLISESSLQRLVVFLDDFSELKFVDQKLFVDIILSPLNNSSNESIKLKIAGYPGRIYYGKIDPSKVDTLSLDFSDLYETSEVQEMERSAIDYTKRLLLLRFNAFQIEPPDYFDTSSNSIDDYFELLFQASFNVPRIIGHILHHCYLDRISKGQKINAQAIRLASQKYYENTISQYFDRMNRFALEPFENKIDRVNQKKLLEFLVTESKSVRKGILDGSIGGSYFSALRNPPTSHFIVDPQLEGALSSLESNFLLTRYKKIRDKNGQPALVFALFFGLCESERMTWGYPAGRDYRNYFVQRCFEFTRAVTTFISSRQTIRCGICGSSYGLEKKEMFETYSWTCPECRSNGSCRVISLANDFEKEVAALDDKLMLEPIELKILECLEDEGRPMRAGEIAPLIDSTFQLVGRRTSKMNDQGLVEKKRDANGRHVSSVSDRARQAYFS